MSDKIEMVKLPLTSSAGDNAVMSRDAFGVNAVEVNGGALLLTTTGGGVAVHLTAPASQEGGGREAAWDFSVDRGGKDDAGSADRYDRRALSERRWLYTTLCGRQWAVMVGGEGGAIGPFGEVAFAPTCRRCLSLIDRHFAPPTPDARLPLIVGLAADAVINLRGFAEVHGVPGDQQEALRREVRTLIRLRTGHSVRTYCSRGIVYIECHAIYEQHAGQVGREASEAVGRVLSGEPVMPQERDWAISWAAWDVD